MYRHPFERAAAGFLLSSAIPPHLMKDAVISYFHHAAKYVDKTSYVDKQLRPRSWAEIHEFNEKIDWGKLTSFLLSCFAPVVGCRCMDPS